MFASALCSTCRPTLSSSRRRRHDAPSACVITSTPLPCTSESVAGIDERGRVRLLDHRRPGEPVRRRKRLAAVDRAGDGPLGVEPDLPLAARPAPPPAPTVEARRRLGAERRHAQVDQLDRLARQREAVLRARARRRSRPAAPASPRRRDRRPAAGPRARSSGRRSACRPTLRTLRLRGIDAAAQLGDRAVAQRARASRRGRRRRRRPNAAK